MLTKPPTEKMLDRALELALRENRGFANWLLCRTKFAGEQATCVFCRSNNPWSTVRLDVESSDAGRSSEFKTHVMQCETDVLAVFQTHDGRRLGLHIENKLIDGSFTRLQPVLYRERVSQWRGRQTLGNYTDATTVLIAPKAFYERFSNQVAMFDVYVSHEDVAKHVPLFRLGDQ